MSNYIVSAFDGSPVYLPKLYKQGTSWIANYSDHITAGNVLLRSSNAGSREVNQIGTRPILTADYKKLEGYLKSREGFTETVVLETINGSIEAYVEITNAERNIFVASDNLSRELQIKITEAI